MEEILGWTREFETKRKPHKLLTFEITAEDIAKGKVKSHGGMCPVERAVWRKYKYTLVMGLTCFHIFGKKYWYRNNNVNSDLACFVSAFDNFQEVKPGTFSLEVPEEFE